MKDVTELENSIKSMIDDLQGLCSQNGLSNQAGEEEVITGVFLYKFLNDKFVYNLEEYAKTRNLTPEAILKSEKELDRFYDTYSEDVAFKAEDTIQELAKHVGDNEFGKEFDDALERISDYEHNDEFSVKTSGGAKKPLFKRITGNVESSKRNNFAKNIFGIITKEKFDFTDAFATNFDFYSAIFEYLIKDYNVASGTYAEYFTPQAVSSVIAKILVEMSPVEDRPYEIYDPSAGSGSLVLHLANALGKGTFGDKAQVYTQDISGKSTRFLRINMLLNGLTGSLEHIVEGDTLTSPAHFVREGEPSSGLKQFDYITSNPPFKMDFSTTRDAIEKNGQDSQARNGLKRFFAGVPKVPEKKKESMAIYLCFIQHILWSLKDNGKAAIVVPTGFLTAQAGIEKEIRQTIIDKRWLKGAISMPSNIFANTNTNVSVLFIDKSNSDGEIMLIDASNLGEKRKEGKNQRTILRSDEITLIEDTFINKDVVEDFSVLVTYDDIKKKNCSFLASQYFEVKIEYVELTQEEFDKKINLCKNNLNDYFEENEKLKEAIEKELDNLRYE